MSVTLRVDRRHRLLLRADGRVFDASARRWIPSTSAHDGGEAIDPIDAVCWLVREGGVAQRVPVGVIGPREATPAQLDSAEHVGAGLARMGLAVLCGGRGGVMQATCRGVARANGLSIGLIPEADPSLANPDVRVVVATGIGEARNALIARASLCLVAIGDSYGTLSEVALGRQFGKRVIGLHGAARVEGVTHVASADEALACVAGVVLALDEASGWAGLP